MMVKRQAFSFVWLIPSVILAIVAMEHHTSPEVVLPLYTQVSPIQTIAPNHNRNKPVLLLSHAKVLDAYQIGQYAYQAGFRRDGLVLSVAIALAESSGVVDQIGPVGEVGLWQVYMPAHPQYSKAFLLNPLNNAQAAYAISNAGSNWRPWCTAWSDALCGTRGGAFEGINSPYQRYLPQASELKGMYY